MKKAVLMAVVMMMAPVLASAQSRWSISPALGFYKAELDALSDAYPHSKRATRNLVALLLFFAKMALVT